MKKLSHGQMAAIVIVILIAIGYYRYLEVNSNEYLSQQQESKPQDYSSIPESSPDTTSNKQTSVIIKPVKPKYEDPVLGPEPDYNSYSDQMQAMYAKVCYQSEQEFFIAKRQGELMQIYVQASQVCAAYLQARDENNYKKWKMIEQHYKRKIGF